MLARNHVTRDQNFKPSDKLQFVKSITDEHNAAKSLKATLQTWDETGKINISKSS